MQKKDRKKWNNNISQYTLTHTGKANSQIYEDGGVRI